MYRFKKNKRILRFLSGMTAILLLVTLVTGCDDDEVVPVEPVALVSFYQGSPNSPDLDIEVDDRQINFYPFAYTDYTGYLRFYTGDRHFEFSPYEASNVAIDTTLTFMNDHVYSVFVADEYNDAGVVVLNDDAPSPTTGKAIVRVINLSPDAPDIDLMDMENSEMIAGDLAFKEATAFTTIDAGEYDFMVRNAATDAELISSTAIKLQSSYYYTIIIRGYETPPAGNPNVLSFQIVVN